MDQKIFALSECELEHISLTYSSFSEKYGTTSHFRKNSVDVLKRLHNPVVLYCNEDISFYAGEGINDQRSREALLEKIEDEEFLTIDGIEKRFKDQNLVESIRNNGGVIYSLEDRDHWRVILVWAGKTQEEVETIVNADADWYVAADARDALYEAVKVLYKRYSKEQLKLEVEELYDKLVNEDIHTG
jgi:hypothetical protein